MRKAYREKMKLEELAFKAAAAAAAAKQQAKAEQRKEVARMQQADEARRQQEAEDLLKKYIEETELRREALRKKVEEDELREALRKKVEADRKWEAEKAERERQQEEARREAEEAERERQQLAVAEQEEAKRRRQQEAAANEAKLLKQRHDAAAKNLKLARKKQKAQQCDAAAATLEEDRMMKAQEEEALAAAQEAEARKKGEEARIKQLIVAISANDGTLLGLPAQQQQPKPKRQTPTNGASPRKTYKQLSVDTTMLLKDKRRTDTAAAKKAKARERQLARIRGGLLGPNATTRTTRSKAKATRSKMEDNSSKDDSIMPVDSFDSDEQPELQKPAGESPSTASMFTTIEEVLAESSEMLAQRRALDI